MSHQEWIVSQEDLMAKINETEALREALAIQRNETLTAVTRTCCHATN